MNKDVKDKLQAVLESVETEEDLFAVNKAVIKYINERRRVAAVKESLKYQRGDRVWWNSRKGYKVEGTVIRVNQKTLTVDSDDGRGWRVPYTMVKKV